MVPRLPDGWVKVLDGGAVEDGTPNGLLSWPKDGCAAGWLMDGWPNVFGRLFAGCDG